MTYRELLKLYKQGKLEDSTKKQIEAEIEKQDAISEFLMKKEQYQISLIWRVGRTISMI